MRDGARAAELPTPALYGKIIFYSLVNDLVNDVMLKGVEFLGM